MTRLHQLPVLLLATLTLFLLAPPSTNAVTVNEQFCITCRDGGDCSKAYFSLAGHFCYDFTATTDATAVKTACCCASSFVCGASNATTTECNCDYDATSTKKPSTSSKTPAPTTAAPKKTEATSVWVWVGVGVGALFLIIIVGVGYVYCMKYQTKRAMGMMQDAHVVNAIPTAQHQQLQAVYMQQQGGQQQQQGGRYNNSNAAL